MKTIRDFDLKGKKVIIRCDFNVPMKNGKIQDDTRIKASLETIKYAIEKDAKVILLSHLGRIKTIEDKVKNSLSEVSIRLQELLGVPVIFSKETRGNDVEEKINNLKSGEVILLENTRYEDLEGKKESHNDQELGKYWASLGDVFINDAFGTVHREHASNVGIAKNLPSGIGFLIEKELNNLAILETPCKPFMVILGGAKVKDKIGVIENLITKADKILIGGGMAFTFLKSQGYEIGKSLLDEDSISFCQKILQHYKDKIILPIDIVVSEELSSITPSRIVNIFDIKEDVMGLDIGPKTIELFCKNLADAKTIIWNGPLGAYEIKKYQAGTKEVLDYIVKLEAKTILGGGDIVAASNELGYKDKVFHASTGGGATLEYLEGKILPGLSAIQEGSENNGARE